MGATSFSVVGRGPTARAAFDALVRKTRDDCTGNGDSTAGTIAVKSNFTMRTLPASVDPTDRRACFDHADDLTMIEEGQGALTKYGPAACVPLGGDEWMFVGIAPI